MVYGYSLLTVHCVVSTWRPGAEHQGSWTSDLRPQLKRPMMRAAAVLALYFLRARVGSKDDGIIHPNKVSVGLVSSLKMAHVV